MGVTYKEFWGAELGTIHEFATPGHMTVVTTPAPTDPDETYRFLVNDSGSTQPRSKVHAPGTSNWITVGVAGVRFNSAMLTRTDVILDWSHGRARFNSSGNFEILDANSAVMDVLTAPFVADVDYEIVVKFKRSNSGQFRLWIDDVLKSDLSGKDVDTGTDEATLGIGPAPATPYASPSNMHWDRGFLAFDDGANIDTFDANPGKGKWNVLAYDYAKTTAARDWGSHDLDAGTGDNIMEIRNSDSNTATYNAVANVDKIFGLSFNNGPLPGVVGDARVTGTILAIRHVWRLRKTSSMVGDQFFGRYGSHTSATTDGTQDTPQFSGLTTSFKNFEITESTVPVDIGSRYLQVGVKNSGAGGLGRHMVIAEWGVMVMHKKPAGRRLMLDGIVLNVT